MNTRDKEIRDYYRQIERCLPGSAKAKKRIMDSIRQSVGSYLEENPKADMAAVQSHFGTPNSIAASYVEQMDTEEVIKKFDIKKTVIGIVCGALFLALLLWAVCLVMALVDEHDSDSGYGEYEPVIEIQTEEIS